MGKKEALVMLLDAGKSALEKEDYPTFDKISGYIQYIDDYQELTDKLHDMFDVNDTIFFKQMEDYEDILEELVDLKFPGADKLLEIVTESLAYFGDLVDR